VNGDPIKQALEALGQVLGITAAVDGAVIKAGLVPDISTLDLKNFSLSGLSVPIVAPLRLSGAGKNVGFPTGAIVDGDPADPATRLVADPLPDAADLSTPGAQPDSPLQTILGLLAGVEGSVPVGTFIPDFVTVTATVCWHVEPDRDCVALLPLADGESVGGDVVTDGERKCAAVTTGSSVELAIVPPLVPLKASSGTVECIYRITADVTLRALGVEHTQQVGPVDVPVPAIGVPTVLVVFSEVRYNTSKDGGRMVIVPTDVPVQQLQALIGTLNSVQSALANLTGLVRIVGLLTGLSSIINALGPVPAGSKHKLIFTSLDETGDLGAVASDWRHRPFWDDHGAEDDIDSLLMVSLDQRLELFEDQDFEDTEVDIEPSSSQFWIGIPDFHNVKSFTPADASVTTTATNFSDEAHSLRFLPRN
jgi:hypothetical protein